MGIFRQFPYSNFHEMNMDELIKICRTMQEEWDETKAEWASYKEFIDNFFATLDLNEEVLNALRVMASDGSLNEIMDPVIISETELWLNENITEPVGVIIDRSLNIQGACADAKATGEAINNLKKYKVAQPVDENNQPYNGTNGQSLRTKGDGTTEWADVGLPTDEQTAQAVSDWLDAHPEATTTVVDGSLTADKFSNTLKNLTIKDYVTPEMFGAVGDQIVDDTHAIQDCLDYAYANNYAVIMPKKYLITDSLDIQGINTIIMINDLYYTDDGYAIEAHNLKYSDIHISKIFSDTGNGIHFTSSDNDDYSQYTNLYIDSIHALDYCMRVDKNDGYGWINEIRVHNAKLSTENSLGTGLYINGHNTNGWRLYNLGLEGLNIGIHSNGNNNQISLMTPRVDESINTIMKSESTQGKTSIMAFLQTLNISPSKFDFDTHARGQIIGMAYSGDGSMLGCNYMVDNGVISPIIYRPISVDISGNQSSFDVSEFYAKYVTLFKIQRTANTVIKLSNLYGVACGINHFSIYVDADHANVTVKDANDNTIFNNSHIEKHATYEFDYNAPNGWSVVVKYPVSDYRFDFEKVSIESLTLTNCTSGTSESGYVRIGNIIIVNLRVTNSDTSFSISGLPQAGVDASYVGASSSNGTCIVNRNGTVQVSNATLNQDTFIHTVYIALD